MENEIKKSYNPFKMWGSWVGFGVGIVAVPLYLGDPSILRDLLGTPITAINPFLWLLGWPTKTVVLVTPIVIFFYGWGIHSLFRRLTKEQGIKVFCVIVVLVIISSIYFYTDSKQSFKNANPYYDYSADSLLNMASNESLVIDERLTAIEVIAGKVGAMNPGQTESLKKQLELFGNKVDTFSQLSEADKERMRMRITMLQEILEAKK